MTTVILGELPAELEALLERRRKWGADRWDEVWDGVLHMVPSPSYGHARLATQLLVILDQIAGAAGLEATMSGFNLGLPQDHRIPDGGLHRPGTEGIWLPTAELVVEIISPNDDESWQKLGFYAARDVGEVLIVDPAKRSVDWLGLRDGAYAPIERSGLIALGPAALAEQLTWP